MEFEFSKEKTALPRRAMSKEFQISDLVDFKDLLDAFNFLEFRYKFSLGFAFERCITGLILVSFYTVAHCLSLYSVYHFV